jgi:hypothetical protein
MLVLRALIRANLLIFFSTIHTTLKEWHIMFRLRISLNKQEIMAREWAKQ